MAGLEGMTPIEKIRAIQKNPSLNLQNPYGLRSNVNQTNVYTPKYSNPNGFNRATALNPDGTTKTVVGNGLSSNNSYGLSNRLQDTWTNSTLNPNQSFGSGTYGTWTSPSGGVIGLNQEAYNAVQNPYVSDGTALNFSGTAGQDAGWWSANKDTVGGIAQGVQALAGLANAYMGYKNYGLAKDQFNFAKAAANRDVANQARLINNEIQNAGEVGMGLAGNTMDPNARAQRQAQLDAMKVSGAPIG